MSNSAKKKYVLGFFFTPEGVVLMFRTKEDWQQGLWNGIGGSIEDGERPREAMVREFEEEALIKTSQDSWKAVCLITGINHKNESYELHVFECWWPLELKDFKMHQNEEGVVCVSEVFSEPMDSTARWILNLCVDRHVSKLRIEFP